MSGGGGEQLPEYDAILAVLRRHATGAFNGSQVACAAPECRAWMETDLWRQHQAKLIAVALTKDGSCRHTRVRDFRDGDGGHRKCLDCGKNLTGRPGEQS